MNNTKMSRFLSLVLRHKPNEIGIQLDAHGWISTDVLLRQLRKHGKDINIVELKELVASNDKKRFAFNDDFSKIRANQGHSIQVELAYQPIEPPEFLYHGTVSKNLEAIEKVGLLKMNRHHVHLSESIPTATKVGSRRGKPIILIVKAKVMHSRGYVFYKSENNVWLTDAVPFEYIDIQ